MEPTVYRDGRVTGGYTAPVTAVLRNGFGTLEPLTPGIVIAELLVLGILVVRVVVQLFRYGSIAHTDKLDVPGCPGTQTHDGRPAEIIVNWLFARRMQAGHVERKVGASGAGSGGGG